MCTCLCDHGGCTIVGLLGVRVSVTTVDVPLLETAWGLVTLVYLIPF